MGSLRRLTAFLGLAGLGWIGYTLLMGDLTLADAGIRAAAIFGAVTVLSWVAGLGVRILASTLES